MGVDTYEMERQMCESKKKVVIELAQRSDNTFVASVIIPVPRTSKNDKLPPTIILDQVVYGEGVQILVLLGNGNCNLKKLDFQNEFCPYIEFKDKTWKNYNYTLHAGEFLKNV